jgi:hypothetical protein
MKKQLFSFVAAASLLSITKPVLADDQASVQDTEKMIQKMTVQARALETQMKTLNSQIHELKTEQQDLKKQVRTQKAEAVAVTNTKMTTTITSAPQTNYVEAMTVSPQACMKPCVKPVPFIPLPNYLSGSPVTITSYLGSHNSFSPFDLVVTYTDYMENLNILQLRQTIFNSYRDSEIAPPTGPILMLSGKVEGQAIYQGNYISGHSSKIDLSAAELDLIPIINKWAGGFVSFKYDNSQAPNVPLTNNSRVHLDQGFLTLGNLNRSPIYLTMGQFYIPFGNYSSLMISSPFTQQIFQTRARALELAYQHPCNKGPYAQVYVFNGDSNVSNNNNINNLGGNIGFGYSQGDEWNIDTSVGAIANVADSLGFQQTNLPSGFTGYSVANSENLVRQVPGVSAHLNFGIGQFGMKTEYDTATSDFAPQDLMFNGQGARPAALNVEGFYNFRVIDRPSVVVLSYGESWQALAVGAPQYRYEASFLTSVWKDTLQQIEFRHDINYQNGDTASGAGVLTPASAIGGSSNTLTLLLGIYF